jgi:hypothetical protein
MHPDLFGLRYLLLLELRRQPVYAEVVNSRDIEKTVRIVITSGMLNHDRFLGGLKESLAPACEKVTTASLCRPPPVFLT